MRNMQKALARPAVEANRRSHLGASDGQKQDMTNRRTGRRPGDPEDTKRTILDAARRTFSAKGFDRATIRSVAAAAEVDPALVMHHFGDKRRLFVAAHELPANPTEVANQIAELPMAERGQAIARFYLDFFAPGSTPLSLLKAATTEPAAASMLREFVQSAVIPLGVPLLDQPERDGQLRAALIASHLLGIAVARNMVEIAPLAEPTLDELAAAIAPAIQHYIDGQPRT